MMRKRFPPIFSGSVPDASAFATRAYVLFKKSISPLNMEIGDLLFYKVLTSGSSLMNKYADHAFNGILKVSFTIVGDSMSLYVILIGVTLDVFPVAYILERPF